MKLTKLAAATELRAEVSPRAHAASLDTGTASHPRYDQLNDA